MFMRLGVCVSCWLPVGLAHSVFVDLDGIVEHVAIGSLHQFVPWSTEHLQSVLCFYDLNRVGESRAVSRKVCLLQFQMEQRGIMTLVFSYTRWRYNLLEDPQMGIRSYIIR